MTTGAASAVCGMCIFGIIGIVTLSLGASDHIANNNEIRAWKYGTNGSCVITRVSPVSLICADDDDYDEKRAQSRSSRVCSARTTAYYRVVADEPIGVAGVSMFPSADRNDEHSQFVPVGFGGMSIDDLREGSVVECWSRDFERATVVIWKYYEHAGGPVTNIVVGTIFATIALLLLMLYACTQILST